jgi:uncharacterized protein
MSRVVMKQEWRDLLFLHWEVAVDEVQRRLPKGLVVDTYEGKTYLGLVPFTMKNVRPIWFPAVPWLSHFHETNVRCYVRDQAGRVGVYFFSLEAANPVAVKLARWLFKLPYHWAKMRMKREGSEIIYSSERLNYPPLPAHCRLRYGPKPDTELVVATVGTLEYFLIERYLLFTPGETVYSGRVSHPPYQFQIADYSGLDQNLTDAVGFQLDEPPLLAHFSPGVKVDVDALEKV